MTAPIVVDPQGFVAAAGVYADIHDEQLVPAIADLCAVLQTCGGSAGSDNAGLKWSTDYDPAAYDAVDSLGDLALACGQMHDLLQFTAANHANANSQSGPAPNPGNLVFPPGSVTAYNPPEPPNAFGGNDPEPTGWAWIRGAVQGQVWPNGSPGRLHQAAGAWRLMATKLRMAAIGLPAAHSHIEAQRSPETEQALHQADIVTTRFGTLAEVCDNLATSCDSYADALHNTQQAIIDELVQLAALVAFDEVAGAAVALGTAGGSEAAAQGAMALEINIFGARIAARITALRDLAGLAELPTTASEAITRGVESLRPLLEAEPRLAGADGTVTPGSFTSWANLRRPKLNKPTEDTILASTDKWKRPGDTDEQWYVVQSEDTVKVPINKTYDDKPWVPHLEKTPDGKYYEDPANDSLYPVEPKWEFGHNSGFEHRRLLQRAQNNSWDQLQFNKEVNDHPEWFHVEDRPGNRSHRREQK